MTDELGIPPDDFHDAPEVAHGPRPLLLPVLATFLLVATLPMLLTALVPALHDFGLRLAVQDLGYGSPQIESPGSPGRLLLGGLWLAVAGVAAAAVGRGRVQREALVGASLAVLVQVGLWLLQIDGKVTLLLRQALVIVPDEDKFSYVFALPGFAVLTGLPAAYWLAGQCGALLGAAVVQRVTGKARCPSCSAVVPARQPGPCPVCRAPAVRSGVQWPAVLGGVGGAIGAVLLVTVVLGPSLGLYYRCNPLKEDGICAAAEHAYDQNPSSYVGYERTATGGQEPELMLVHKWRYLAVVAAIVFAMALALAARVVLAEMATAMVATLFAWLGTLLLGVILFSTPTVEGTAVATVQLHLLGMLAWVPAGLAGAIAGQKLRKPVTDEMLDAALG